MWISLVSGSYVPQQFSLSCLGVVFPFNVLSTLTQKLPLAVSLLVLLRLAGRCGGGAALFEAAGHPRVRPHGALRCGGNRKPV